MLLIWKQTVFPVFPLLEERSHLLFSYYLWKNWAFQGSVFLSFCTNVQCNHSKPFGPPHIWRCYIWRAILPLGRHQNMVLRLHWSVHTHLYFHLAIRFPNLACFLSFSFFSAVLINRWGSGRPFRETVSRNDPPRSVQSARAFFLHKNVAHVTDTNSFFFLFILNIQYLLSNNAGWVVKCQLILLCF